MIITGNSFLSKRGAKGGAKSVVIVGAGKLGAVLHDCLDGDERWRCTAFIDDGKAGGTLHGLPIYGTGDLNPAHGGRAFLAVGFPHVRRKLAEEARGVGLEFQTYIDRRSLVGREAELGTGVLVLSFSMIASGTTLGDFSLVMAHCQAGANSRIGSFTSLMAGAAVGGSTVGDDCLLGLRSVALDGARLGERVTLAPLACVRRRPVPDDSLVAGNPGRIFRRRRTAATPDVSPGDGGRVVSQPGSEGVVLAGVLGGRPADERGNGHERDEQYGHASAAPPPAHGMAPWKP